MGDFLYMCSVAIHTGSFIIRGGIFLSTDETHKAFVLFSVYLDIRRCFLYPKALRPQNYKAALSYTWQFQAPFQRHVIHEHFCSQTLKTSQNVAFLCSFREQPYGFHRYCSGRKFWSTKTTPNAKNEYDVVCDVKSRASDRRQ